jgi:hypothetical protein
MEHRKVISLAEFRQRISSDSEQPPPSPKPAAARRPVPPDQVEAFGWVTFLPTPVVSAA